MGVANIGFFSLLTDFQESSGLYYKNMTSVNDNHKWRYSLDHSSTVISYAPRVINGKEATVNRALDGSKYPG